MKWEGSILITDGGTFGITREEKFDSFDGCLPHGGLVDWEVSYVVWLGSSAGVCFEEGIDDFLTCLEGAGGVKGQVSTIVEARCILDKDGLLCFFMCVS